MCPASHGDCSVKHILIEDAAHAVSLRFHSSLAAQGGAPVGYSPTNLTSGGIGDPDHGPASGTEELQEGGTTL
jgi:hypothetical protein